MNPDRLNILNDTESCEINKVIYKNAYIKCGAKSSKPLDKIMLSLQRKKEPNRKIAVFAGNVAREMITKKEVFFFEKDDDLSNNIHKLMKDYEERIQGKIGRNDKCICGSEKKYGKCCWNKFEVVKRVMSDLRNKDKNYMVHNARTLERPILMHEGNADDMPLYAKKLSIMLKTLTGRTQR